jgi:hypothetical protein
VNKLEVAERIRQLTPHCKLATTMVYQYDKPQLLDMLARAEEREVPMKYCMRVVGFTKDRPGLVRQSIVCERPISYDSGICYCEACWIGWRNAHVQELRRRAERDESTGGQT